MSTYSLKSSEIQKNWWIIDAKDIVLGRLASQVALILRGKHKPTYTPHMDCGDYVVVVNAKHIHLSGNKLDKKDGKLYYRHTGFPGGIKQTSAGKMLSGCNPERVVKMAIQRMISRNKLGRKIMKHLYIYSDADHLHNPQKPTLLDLGARNRKNKK